MKYPHLKLQDEFVYSEIFDWNVYNVTPEEITSKNILDIGGHFGMFDLYCNDLNAKQIITVEANPNNFVKLLQNTKDIACYKAINAAVTNNTGDFITIEDKGCQSRINQGNITISTISLTDIISWFPVNEDIVLKMDIEGAEYDIFLKSPSFIFQRFKTIYIEIHDESVAGPGKHIDLLHQYIQNLGFIVKWQGSFFAKDPNGNTTNHTNIAVYKYERI